MGRKWKEMSLRGVSVWILVTLVAASATSRAQGLCQDVVGLLATDFVRGVHNTELPRVEIRQCPEARSGNIQIVAWRQKNKQAPLVLDTADFGVIQMVVRANVFVIETAGATRDQVFVICYQRGEPKLQLKQITRGTARVHVSRLAIHVEIDGIYAGDKPARSESRDFPLDPEGISAPQE